MATISDINNIPYSGDYRADSLVEQIYANWNYLLPSRTTLYYTFDCGSGSAIDLATSETLTAFNTTQKAAATSILNYAQSLTGVSFVETAAGTSADFHFGAINISGSSTSGLCRTESGYSYVSGSEVLTSYNAEAYVYLDNVEFASSNASPSAGTSSYETLLHEIGHALGLGHPFEGPDQLPTADDNTNNTVMSYTRVGANKTTFQSYDELALKWIYGNDGLGGRYGYNSTNGPTLTASGADTTAPTVTTFSPADEASGVAVGSNIVVTFSEAITKGTGNIVLKTAAGVTVAAFDAATSSNLSISGSVLTLNPSSDLTAGTSYRVEFNAGSIKDLAGNSFAGATSYNFTAAAGTLHPPTGTVILSGTATQGQTLTATNTLADADGLGVIRYQWKAAGTDITGATASTFVLTEAQVGQVITVAASYTDGGGTAESKTSAGTTTVMGYQSGTSGNDNLIGTKYADTLEGLAGNDVLNGGAGSDTMTGGDGSDIYYVDNTGDLVTETNAIASTGGTDLVYSTLSAHTLSANVENGRINTSLAANLTGNGANNVLYAGAGHNVFDGMLGTDTVSYQYATTAIQVSLALTSGQLTGGSGTDTLTSIENLIGGSANDNLTGNTLANSLSGGAGNDVLTGGRGADMLTGDTGADRFDFNGLAELGLTSTTWDTILDFKTSELDKIDLQGVDANTALAGNQAFSYLGTAAFTGNATAKLRFDAVNHILYGSTDADTAAEFAILLTGVSSLGAADLVL